MVAKPAASVSCSERSNPAIKVGRRKMSPRLTKGRKGKGRKVTNKAKKHLGGVSKNKDVARAPAPAAEASRKRVPTRLSHSQELKKKVSLEEPDVEQRSVGSSTSSSEDL